MSIMLGRLQALLQTSPLYLFMFDYNEASEKPVLVGTASVLLKDLNIPRTSGTVRCIVMNFFVVLHLIVYLHC